MRCLLTSVECIRSRRFEEWGLWFAACGVGYSQNPYDTRELKAAG